MIYHCCDERRRELVLASALNGIDFVEVLDREAPAGTPRQRTLLLRFLKVAPNLTPDNIELTGGDRITGVGIEWLTRADNPDATVIGPAEAALPGFLTALPEAGHVLALRTTSSGDYATYTLRLVESPGALSPPLGIDRVLSQVEFSFKVECPTDFDCAPLHDCPEDAPEPPALSYLTKDYRSFRRLMLGRMAQLLPDWRERSPADLGVTLVELLAYTADRLSYAQDAVATEAYLASARRRSSVRRHARLVDYRMHDGANARAWVHLETDTDGVTVNPDTDRFLTRLIGFPPAITDPGQQRDAFNLAPLVFQPLHAQTLFVLHNAMPFYEWGDGECCLRKGATRATLAGHLPGLVAGDVLVFEERLGPRTGREADADPERRHAVRLTAVETGLTDDVTGAAITEIRWAAEDALPFPFCLSSRLDDSAAGGLATNVSHALGNIVLVDHGLGIAGEDLGQVPEPHLHVVATSADPCRRAEPVPVPPRYRPTLREGPVSQVAGYDPAAPAFAAGSPGRAGRSPAVTLHTAAGDWLAVPDLLNSGADDPHFVVEAEADGSAHLRFGDDRNGRRPNAGTGFTADYRVGNGSLGNVGRGGIRHIVTGAAQITAVRNPLPATGGVDPEGMEEVRQAAPYAYRRQERAVTAEDYAAVALRYPDVQRAVATFRWNGHGHTVFVTVDRFGGRPVTPEFEADLRAFIDGFRMAGYDLEVDAPRFVPVEIVLFVCVAPDHFRSEVRRAVLEALGAGRLPDGSLGHFHPDNLSFGQPVRLSPIYARAMRIEGVSSVAATLFRRRGSTDPKPLQDGVLTFGRLEIAQLENDPSFPERGSLTIETAGGK